MFTPSLLNPDVLHSEKQECWLVEIHVTAIPRVLTLLHDHPHCCFHQLIDITAVDYPDKPHRFEVVYHFLSHPLNQRLRLKARVNEHTLIPSITSIFENAGWYEREVFDLFGLLFKDNRDLRRILTDYNFDGHPMRKDFSLTGYTQVKYSVEKGSVVSEPVALAQPYRSFDFLSPWEGTPVKQLPGDEKV